MELLNKKYGVKALTFMDDDFNSDRQKMVDLVEALEEKKLDMSWFCLSRAQNLIRDMDLVPRLRKVGLYQVLIGIDGGTDEEIAEARKGPMKVGVKELKELIQFLRKNDISTISTYLNGFWEDDEAKIRQRAKAVDEIDPDIVMIQVLNPIPGSPIYKEAVKNSIIEIDNLSLYDLEHCVMPTKHLTRQQLGELTGWAFQSFYSKPGRIERILNGYSSPYVKMKFLILQEQRRQIRKGRGGRYRRHLVWPSHGRREKARPRFMGKSRSSPARAAASARRRQFAWRRAARRWSSITIRTRKRRKRFLTKWKPPALAA